MTAKYAPWVSLLREDTAHVRARPAAAYWALMPYYVPQYTNCACSLASATMVVNALRGPAARVAGSQLVSQPMLLDEVGDAAWREGVTPPGGGITLAQMGPLLAASLARHGIAGAAIDTVPVPAATAPAGDALRAALRATEADATRFVIPNFYMAAVIGGGDYGHFSPVGAYDEPRDRVLLLDVYRFEFEPYWVPVDRLLAGMATIDRDGGRPRGYVALAAPPPAP